MVWVSNGFYKYIAFCTFVVNLKWIVIWLWLLYNLYITATVKISVHAIMQYVWSKQIYLQSAITARAKASKQLCSLLRNGLVNSVVWWLRSIPLKRSYTQSDSYQASNSWLILIAHCKLKVQLHQNLLVSLLVLACLVSTWTVTNLTLKKYTC